MRKSDISINKLREKKKKFLEREIVIRNSAISLLKNQNIDKVTVSSIARDAGIGKGTVYKHFLSKTEILLRIILDYDDSVSSRVKICIKESADSNDPFYVIRAYFLARLSDPLLDILVRNLKVKLKNDPQIFESVSHLDIMKEETVSSIVTAIKSLITTGSLRKAPPIYYYFSYVALIEGAIDLFLEEDFNINDKEELLAFLISNGCVLRQTPLTKQ